MKIVSDSGADLSLTSGELADMDIHVVPLTVTLNGKTYHEGVDINPEKLYHLLTTTPNLPTTSQPSVGDFTEVYKRLAAIDPDILSIHMSSGLSGTLSTAQAAARMVPEAHVTHIDTKTLSVAAGWQVEAAARAIKANWSKEQIIALIGTIGAATESLYTLKDLRYLIHGGRISHLKGLLASLLDIKPLIGVDRRNGKYVQRGQARTFQGAIEGIVNLMNRQHATHSALRVQVRHAYNPEGAAILRDLIDKRFKCTWLPIDYLSTVLGAHTGPSMVGVAYAPTAAFADMP